MRRAILVTGGSGLLGLNWAITRRASLDVTLAVHNRPIRLRGVSCRQIDLKSTEDLTRAVQDTGCSLVVHTAGMTNVESCEAAPDMARHVNVDLALNVARVCATANIPLVHISTDHLFGGDHGLIAENDPVMPINVYGRTKAEAEQRVLDLYPGALVIRTNFYGWGPSYRPSFSDQIITSLRARRPITLFRDVTYSPILMEPLIDAVHELVERRANGICHVVGDDTVTKLEFGRRLTHTFELDERYLLPSSIDDKPELVPRPRRMGLSNAKATAALGRRIGGITEHLALLLEQGRRDATLEIDRL